MNKRGRILVNFNKKLQRKKLVIVDNPIKIYEQLDRQSEKGGPLREAQTAVLKEWFNNRINDKDIILKLNTGAGKTLVGLLILESKLRQKKKDGNTNFGIELFLCNNQNLIEQTKEQAELFGINVETLDTDNNIPSSVINGEKILITSVQKFFNGKSIFERSDAPSIDTVIVDDAHTSAEIIKHSFTMTITKKNNSSLYNDLFSLLSDGLKSQGEGTFESLKSSTSYKSLFLPVPYWTWIDKLDSIVPLLTENSESPELLFVWPVIKDMLKWCDCICSEDSFEIKPITYPIDFYQTFQNSKQRIFMSATTASDTVLINDLDVSPTAVENPITYSGEGWSGEKMVILPSLISDSLNRSEIVKTFGSVKSSKVGITVIIPGRYRSNDWKKYGATIGMNEQLDQKLKEFYNGIFTSPLVLVNRYDGIDLPDKSTRILILDSLPSASSLFDRYLDEVLPDGSESVLRKAQKIEQGMGRSVRADTDYSVILFIGSDLVRFVRDPNNQQFFSSETLSQINIGIDNSNDAKKEYSQEKSQNPDIPINENKPLFELISQSLNRDDGWKTFYREKMSEVDYTQSKNETFDLIKSKHKIMQMAINPVKDIETFITATQTFIDKYCTQDKEKGFYLQLLARVLYIDTKYQSNKYQISAFKKNHKLLLPDKLDPVKKIEGVVSTQRLENIINQIKSYKTFENFQNSANEIISNLDFQIPASKFESSLDEMGKILGFVTDRPDDKYRKGPDHLWGVADNFYFIIEDKSEVKDSREKIHKEETGQMNNSVAWFTNNYPNAKFKAFLVIPTAYPDPAGGFNGDVEIIRKRNLKKLRSNFNNFVKEFRTLSFDSLSTNQIKDFVNLHHLSVDDLSSMYSEPAIKSR